jgi:hypothetical protein
LLYYMQVAVYTLASLFAAGLSWCDGPPTQYWLLLLYPGENSLAIWANCDSFSDHSTRTLRRLTSSETMYIIIKRQWAWGKAKKAGKIKLSLVPVKTYSSFWRKNLFSFRNVVSFEKINSNQNPILLLFY